MIIHNKELWKLILAQKDSLVPKKYYIYKTGTVGSSHIAEDMGRDTGKKSDGRSAVVYIVDRVLDHATKALKCYRDNKTAAMCEIDLGNNKKIEVYFSFFDNKRTICLEVDSESPAQDVPLLKKKEKRK